MTSEGRHYRTSGDDGLTPRQRQVIERIAHGETNGEIAAALGITLDGAKWHVREILLKYRCDSREEAAARWLARRSLRERAARFKRGGGLLAGIKLTAAAATVIACVAVAIVLFSLFRDGADELGVGEPAATVAAMPPGGGLSSKALTGLPVSQVRAVRLYFVNHPYRETQPRPLDSADAANADLLAQLVLWIQGLAPSGLPVSRSATGPPWATLTFLLEDGTELFIQDANDCKQTATMTTCVPAGPFVDVSHGEGQGIRSGAIRMNAPELAEWLRFGWRDALDLVPSNAAHAAWEGLKATVP